MTRIFLSYRRDDSGGYAGRLFDRLSQRFGQDSVFMDVDTIPPGLDFVEAIGRAVGSCEVFLAVIGRQWLTITDPQGHRRLDNPEDNVRLEITAALERGIRVIPVLVGGASMPRSTELPDVLQPLARRNALVVGDYFNPDVARLIAALETILEITSSRREEENELLYHIGMEFVLIHAGEFLMGSGEGIDDERPMHHVQISQPFYLGKYEVTQSQWEAVMGNNPSRFTDNPNRPVENVSWEDVQVFIRTLNSEDGAQYRLPTEAEWEYACRADAPGAYCFGNNSDQLGQYAWYEANSGGQTQPVGQLQPNAWGLHDMHGNVYEWVHDWYGKYPPGAVIDPRGPSRPTMAPDRINRGGSWDHDAWGCRSARRGRLTPDSRRDNLGFRLLRTAP